MRYLNALLPNTDYDDVTYTSSPCLWCGEQTANKDCDWLKQLKLFSRLERFVMAETKQF